MLAAYNMVSFVSIDFLAWLNELFLIKPFLVLFLTFSYESLRVIRSCYLVECAPHPFLEVRKTEIVIRFCFWLKVSLKRVVMAFLMKFLDNPLPFSDCGVKFTLLLVSFSSLHLTIHFSEFLINFFLVNIKLL